jgi:hypothetical protein
LCFKLLKFCAEHVNLRSLDTGSSALCESQLSGL